MKKNKSLAVSLLSLFDYFFQKSIYVFYFLYFLIILYYVLLLLNDRFRTFNNMNEEKFINKVRKALTIYHYVLKMFIAMYLMIKFNPIYKIKFKGSNDKNIIFNSGLLLFMSIIIIDPLIFFTS